MTFALVTDDVRHVVLDRAEVGFCDSSGIRALVELYRHRRDREGTVSLAGSASNVARAVDIAGLGDLIRSYPTVDEALGALPPARGSG